VTIIAQVGALLLLFADVIALLLLVISPFFFFLVFRPYSTAADRLETVCSWALFFLFCQIIMLLVMGTVGDAYQNGFRLDTVVGIVLALLFPIFLLWGAAWLLLKLPWHWRIVDIVFWSLEKVGGYIAPLVIVFFILLLVKIVVYISFAGVSYVVDVAGPLKEQGTLPFYIAACVGFVLLAISIKTKNAIISALGAALIAAGFSHWIGPITFPK
jgi:hypothetical protein